MFQDAPTNTFNFMLLGYGAIFTILFGYLVTWLVRQANLKKDLDLLKSLEAEDKKK
jgi:CcmD family protein